MLILLLTWKEEYNGGVFDISHIKTGEVKVKDLNSIEKGDFVMLYSGDH
jgi:hypothetical protein